MIHDWHLKKKKKTNRQIAINLWKIENKQYNKTKPHTKEFNENAQNIKKERGGILNKNKKTLLYLLNILYLTQKKNNLANKINIWKEIQEFLNYFKTKNHNNSTII